MPEGFAPPPGLELPADHMPPPGLQTPVRTWADVAKPAEPKVSMKTSDSDEETRASCMCSESDGSDGESLALQTPPPSLDKDQCESNSDVTSPVKLSLVDRLEVEERTRLSTSAPVFTPAVLAQPSNTTPPPGLRTKLSTQAQSFVPSTKLSKGAQSFVPMGGW